MSDVLKVLIKEMQKMQNKIKMSKCAKYSQGIRIDLPITEKGKVFCCLTKKMQHAKYVKQNVKDSNVQKYTRKS